ncbi:hypothetical protein CDL15_Pgr018467 [Punica granatum]|uniref:Gnk2-homologous domain-containing protein n=1 Tax=Punica granatum TaxID=22663 RepID=A0A218WZA5_PUNGR|nr:hypothetical protein CDL15_Pgr018467 [Punica granatum]
MVSLPIFQVTVITFLLIFTINARSLPDTTVQLVLCNSQAYSRGDPFGNSLTYVISDLELKTASMKDYNYYDISPYPNAFAYGHATCNQNLTSLDCGTCLDAAKSAMLGTCQDRIGARSVLRDCSIRYEQYPFDY